MVVVRDKEPKPQPKCKFRVGCNIYCRLSKHQRSDKQGPSPRKGHPYFVLIYEYDNWGKACGLTNDDSWLVWLRLDPLTRNWFASRILQWTLPLKNTRSVQGVQRVHNRIRSNVARYLFNRYCVPSPSQRGRVCHHPNACFPRASRLDKLQCLTWPKASFKRSFAWIHIQQSFHKRSQ